MVTHKTLATLSVVGLLLLAGCSTLTDLTEQKTTAEKIEDSMNSVETVQVNTTTTQTISIRDNRSIINHTRESQIRTRYNISDNSYITQGIERQLAFGKSDQFIVERYHQNGKTYTKQSSSIDNQSQWNSTETQVNVRNEVASAADADFLSNYNATINNSTITYRMNMAENGTLNIPNNKSFTPYGGQNDLIDTYIMEIQVDNETHRIQRILIFVQAQLNDEELTELNERYGEGNSTKQGRLTYIASINYSSYNEPVNITVPEEAKSNN